MMTKTSTKKKHDDVVRSVNPLYVYTNDGGGVFLCIFNTKIRQTSMTKNEMIISTYRDIRHRQYNVGRATVVHMKMLDFGLVVQWWWQRRRRW